MCIVDVKSMVHPIMQVNSSISARTFIYSVIQRPRITLTFIHSPTASRLDPDPENHEVPERDPDFETLLSVKRYHHIRVRGRPWRPFQLRCCCSSQISFLACRFPAPAPARPPPPELYRSATLSSDLAFPSPRLHHGVPFLDPKRKLSISVPCFPAFPFMSAFPFLYLYRLMRKRW